MKTLTEEQITFINKVLRYVNIHMAFDIYVITIESQWAEAIIQNNNPGVGSKDINKFQWNLKALKGFLEARIKWCSYSENDAIILNNCKYGYYQLKKNYDNNFINCT